MRHIYNMRFASAYSQLQTIEREFVDGFLRRLDTENTKAAPERITTTLERVAASINFDELDSRARDQFAKPMVNAAIREAVEDLARERDLLPARIIQEHANIAFANMQDFFELGEYDWPKPILSKLTREQWAAIAEIDIVDEVGRNGSKRRLKFKLHDKLRSLDTLAKFNGLDKAENPVYSAYSMPKLPATVDSATVNNKYAEYVGKFQ